MNAYRQGELLFIPIAVKDVEKLKARLSGRKRITVVAEGEATGHRHELADPDTAILVEDLHIWDEIEGYNPLQENFDKVLHTDTGTTIKHPDHADLELPKGTYIIRSQREYSEETARRVRD
jgi:hypothetical protein